MLQDQQSHQLSIHELEERSAEADAILHHPVFTNAVSEVRSRALNTLIAADIGSLTASTAHATLKAVEEIEAQLKSYVTDLKMRQKYPKGKQDG